MYLLSVSKHFHGSFLRIRSKVFFKCKQHMSISWFILMFFSITWIWILRASPFSKNQISFLPTNFLLFLELSFELFWYTCWCHTSMMSTVSFSIFLCKFYLTLMLYSLSISLCMMILFTKFLKVWYSSYI